MKQMQQKLYLLCLVIFILIIFILPIFSFQGYSIILNSISQLGGQWHPYAWVMNIFGFMLMGFAIVVLFADVKLRLVSKSLVLAFGVLMFLVGFFQHEPIASYGVNNVFESNMHSLIASVMGFAVTAFAIILVFDKNGNRSYRITALVAAMVSSLFSVGLVVFPDYYGLIQRVMFIFILCWLYFVGTSNNNSAISPSKK
jgi:hypothetical membrane protein